MPAMSSAAAAATRYAAAGGETSQLDLLIQAHDGMCAKLTEARDAIRAGDLETRFHATRKVGDVLDVLHAALDFEQGGELAPTLGRLYRYFNRRLIELNAQNDPAICDELIGRMSELRGAWSSIGAAPVTLGGRPATMTA